MRNLPTPSIGLFKGFYYPYFKNSKAEFEPFANFLIDITNQSYIDKCLLDKVEDDFFNEKDIDSYQYIEEIIKMKNDIKNEYGKDSYRARIESSNYTATIYTISSDDGDFIYFRFNDEINKVTSLRYIRILDSYKKIDVYPYINLYYSSKNKNGKVVCKEESINYMNNIDDKYLYLLYHLLKLNDRCEFINPTYGKNECSLIKQCLIHNADKVTTHLINSMRKDDAFALNPIESNVQIDLMNRIQYPLIDFTQKEMKFINKYVSTNDLFNDEKPELRFNLIPYLESPRYGNILRFPFEDKDIIFAYTNDKDVFRFGLLENVSESMWIEMNFDYTNLEEFNVYDSLNQIDTLLILTNHAYIPKSINDINSLLLNLSNEELLDFIQYILSCIIAIHDRPKRTKMVKITERKETNNNQKRNPKNNNEDYVIRRILKPADDAKEYVASHSGGVHKNHEYTLEEWSRVDHWRHLKNGKVVYIHETTIHRKLPLSDKEVHIKL